MSTQRYIDVSFYDDAWVQELDPSEKFMYMYLLTNPLTNIAGVYKITARRISFDTGFNVDTIKHILRKFTEAGKVFQYGEYIILKNWCKHQKVEGNASGKASNVKIGIDRILNELPNEVLSYLKEVGYVYAFLDKILKNKGLEGASRDSNYLNFNLDLDLDLDLNYNSNLNSNSSDSPISPECDYEDDDMTDTTPSPTPSDNSEIEKLKNELLLAKKELEKKNEELKHKDKVIDEQTNLLSNTTSSPTKTKKESTRYSKADYDECRRLIYQNQQTLRERGLRVDETTYSIPVLNRWIKKQFQDYGVEKTKQGIINSIHNEWLVSTTHYSMNGLFNEKMFAKYIADTSTNISKPKPSGTEKKVNFGSNDDQLYGGF